MSFDVRDGSRHLGSRRGLIFLFVVFVIFLQAGFHAGYVSVPAPDGRKWLPDTPRFLSFRGSQGQPVITEHPIPKLMADAELKFKALVQKQSRSLETAVAEYKRRYGINPPKSFDKWWEFAQKYNVKMTDEYDGLMEDLAPFRALSGEEFRRRVEQVSALPSIDIVRVRDGVPTAVNLENGWEDPEASARAHGFRRMLEKFSAVLPDMDFPVNGKAEGRILIPWEHRKYPNLTQQDSSGGIESMLGGEFTPDWQGTGTVWEAYRRTCDPSSPARRLFSSFRSPRVNRSSGALSSYRTTSSSDLDDFYFAENTDRDYSFCDSPWAHYLQGHFFSDWRTIPVLYPVLSPAKAGGFGDIRIPSHYYHGSTSRYTYGWDAVNLILKEVDDMEVPWEQKSDKIFWRGATTGGGSSPPGFSHQYQRHRFLRLASDSSDMKHTIVYSDPAVSSSSYVAAQVPAKDINGDIMDVAFTTSVDQQNFPGGLEAMQSVYRFAEPVPLGEHWRHKYLVDFDGMAYSGRFFALLASDSAVIKSTVYEEFFSDWIQPWLHFIPLSSNYSEIYNIHAFFHGPSPSTLKAANSTTPAELTVSTDGDRRLRRIARAGKQWKRTIGRKVDMEAYVYRLCLEYARLWADDRETMNFIL